MHSQRGPKGQIGKSPGGVLWTLWTLGEDLQGYGHPGYVVPYLAAQAGQEDQVHPPSLHCLGLLWVLVALKHKKYWSAAIAPRLCSRCMSGCTHPPLTGRYHLSGVQGPLINTIPADRSKVTARELAISLLPRSMDFKGQTRLHPPVSCARKLHLAAPVVPP